MPAPNSNALKSRWKTRPTQTYLDSGDCLAGREEMGLIIQIIENNRRKFLNKFHATFGATQSLTFVSIGLSRVRLTARENSKFFPPFLAEEKAQKIGPSHNVGFAAETCVNFRLKQTTECISPCNWGSSRSAYWTTARCASNTSLTSKSISA